jgi:hypothetical protein
MKTNFLVSVLLLTVLFTSCEKSEVKPLEAQPDKVELFRVHKDFPNARNGLMTLSENFGGGYLTKYSLRIEIDRLPRAKYDVIHMGDLSVLWEKFEFVKGEKVTVSGSDKTVYLAIDTDLNLRSGTPGIRDGYEYLLVFPANQTTTHIIK